LKPRRHFAPSPMRFRKSVQKYGRRARFVPCKRDIKRYARVECHAAKLRHRQLTISGTSGRGNEVIAIPPCEREAHPRLSPPSTASWVPSYVRNGSKGDLRACRAANSPK